MPKIVNQAERRELVAAAVLAVAARSGLASTTLRDVAREAGCSTGMLSHYFRDKHELLLFAFRLCGDRLIAGRARITPGPARLARVRETLAGTLPLDSERRAICAILLEFAVQSLYTPDMTSLFREAHGSWCNHIAGLLQAAVDAGEVDPSLDIELQTANLTSFVVGVTRQALVDPDRYPPDRQLAMLDDLLARLATKPTAKGGRSKQAADEAAG